MLCVGWLDKVVVGFLVAVVVVVVVVGTGCSVALGLVGALGRSGASVLFSAGGATDPAANVNRGTYCHDSMLNVSLFVVPLAGDTYLSHIPSCQLPGSCCRDKRR